MLGCDEINQIIYPADHECRPKDGSRSAVFVNTLHLSQYRADISADRLSPCLPRKNECHHEQHRTPRHSFSIPINFMVPTNNPTKATVAAQKSSSECLVAIHSSRLGVMSRVSAVDPSASLLVVP